MAEPETCDWCRFDAEVWTRSDLLGTLDAIGYWWRELARWVEPDLVVARPEPATWSALEYAAHSRDVTAGLGRLLHAIVMTSTVDIHTRPPQPPDLGPFDTVVDELEANAQRLVRRARKMGEDDWSRSGLVDREPRTAQAVVAHALHDATHHLMDAGRGLHHVGAGPATTTGAVVQLSRSDGGVPKLAVPAARIAKGGLDGDRQAARKHHGRPWQALCLWSVEVIERLRAEGHTVAPGAAGENITVSGVDWATLRPGVRLQVGEALVETSLYALPCAKNAQWFVDGDFRRMEHTRQRGISRIYAWVLVDGDVRTGDPVVVEP